MGLCFEKTFDGLNNLKMPEYRNKKIDVSLKVNCCSSERTSRTKENSGSPSPDVHHISPSSRAGSWQHVLCAHREGADMYSSLNLCF